MMMLEMNAIIPLLILLCDDSDYEPDSVDSKDDTTVPICPQSTDDSHAYYRRIETDRLIRCERNRPDQEVI